MFNTAGQPSYLITFHVHVSTVYFLCCIAVLQVPTQTSAFNKLLYIFFDWIVTSRTVNVDIFNFILQLIHIFKYIYIFSTDYFKGPRKITKDIWYYYGTSVLGALIKKYSIFVFCALVKQLCYYYLDWALNAVQKHRPRPETAAAVLNVFQRLW